MAVMQALAGPQPGRQYPLENGRSVLGRHPDCDIVLDSGAVSRRHAAVVKIDGEYFVEDLHSRNGTFVNGQLTQGRQRLASGDRVRVCDLTFQFFHDPPKEQQPTIALDDGAAFGTLMVDDMDQPNTRSSIMSKVDISSSDSGVHFSVNPQAKLKALLEISGNLSKTLAMDEVLPKILDSLFTVFVQADRGFIALVEGEEDHLVPKAVKHRRSGDDEAIRISRTIVNQVMQAKEAILSADASADQRFDMSQSIADFRIRSLICAPLIDSEGNVLGVIQVDTLDQRSQFREEDLQVLAAVASQAAAAIDNAQLHADALRQHQVQRDLSLARKVQESLLPAAPPRMAGYHFFGYYQAAQEIGGDYYGYVPLDQGRMAVVVADVSGKGVAAALLMAKLSAEVRFCLATEPTAAKAITRLNASLEQRGWTDHFVTLVLVVLDPRENTATIVNAGHMAPLLRTDVGQVREVGEEITGFPLGVDEDAEYEQMTIPLAPGDLLTLFTDGFHEAMNPEGECYGLSRLEEAVGAKIESVADLGRHLLDDVKRYVGQQPQSDDMCLACFGRDQA